MSARIRFDDLSTCLGLYLGMPLIVRTSELLRTTLYVRWRGKARLAVRAFVEIQVHQLAIDLFIWRTKSQVV